MRRKLRLILGDQLNQNHSWFNESDQNILYVLMELGQETSYVRHHIQKIVGFFLAMRNFADELQKQGHQVLYLELDSKSNTQSLTDNLSMIIENNDIEHFEYQLPDEYRLDQQLKKFCNSLTIPFSSYDSEHFITTRNFLAEFFRNKKTYLMETFYREMRKQNNVLMDGGEPLSGKWNFDQENRNQFKDPPS